MDKMLRIDYLTQSLLERTISLYLQKQMQGKLKKTVLKKPVQVQKIGNVQQKMVIQNEHHQHKVENIRLLNDTQQNKKKTTVAVIVTFSNKNSYDPLFTSQEQKSLEGTKVQIYVCNSLYIGTLIQTIFNGNPKNDTQKQLIESIKTVEPDCVVFNWECCQHYSGQNFPENKDKVFYFLKKAIDRGHMCMFSDYSLKALIHQWHQKYQLGPNPFVKTGQFAGNFQIKFNPSILKECPSAQLQIVGEMAEDGHCNIHALGGTIQYCVDSTKLNHEVYKTEVLTVVTLKPPKESYTSKIGAAEGCAGHVILKYPSGGIILTSMGHWIQLMKIDTSEKKLFEVAEQQFGVVQATKMKAEYLNMNVEEQKVYVSSKARQFVQSQAPCTNMNKKSKKR